MFSNRYLTEVVRLEKVADSAIAGTTDVNGTGIDMANCEGVIFFTSFGTPAAGNTIKVQQSDDDAAADAYSDLEGTQVAVGASDEDVVVELKRPLKRYVRPVAVRGTSSTAGDIWALVYGLRSTTQVSASVTGTRITEQHQSPDEGTA